jgi:hypothetical protein
MACNFFTDQEMFISPELDKKKEGLPSDRHKFYLGRPNVNAINLFNTDILA